MASDNRVLLTIQERVDILKDWETSSITNVAKRYNVHQATLCRIRQNATAIAKCAGKVKLETCRKNVKRPMYEELEQRLLAWIIERRTTEKVLSDELILQKATELKEEFGASSNFQINTEWLTKFKKRHNIQLAGIYGEEASAEARDKEIKEERNINFDVGRNGQRDEGIKLNREEREGLEHAFKRLERYRNRFPLSARIHLDGLKVTFLGNTALKE